MDEGIFEYLEKMANHKFDYVYLRNLKNLEFNDETSLLIIKVVFHSDNNRSVKEYRYKPYEFLGLLVDDKKLIDYIRISEFAEDGRLIQISDIELDDENNLYVKEKSVCVNEGYDEDDVITRFDKTGNVIEIDFDR